VPVALVPGLINAAAGTNYTLEDLRVIMRRIITLERKFNIRKGFTRKDDTLPTRLLNEPLPEGMAEGKKVEGLDLMLDDYYQSGDGSRKEYLRHELINQIPKTKCPINFKSKILMYF